MENIMDTIYKEMHSDDMSTDDSSDRLKEAWEEATPKEREAMDEVLMCVCGWTYDTLRRKTRDSNS